MNPQTLFDTLARETLLFSAGVVLLALLRPLLLRGLGAGPAYLAWLLVPLVMASPWLPLPALSAPAPPTAVVIASLGEAMPGLRGPHVDASGAGAAPWLLAWAAGTLLAALGLTVMQLRYLAGLSRDDSGRWMAPSGASPAIVGLLPQRLVLPRDFEQRFDAPARRLVLAHEAVHARRHDNAWNLLAASLLCLQWFNPLAWWAWHSLRDDQELACDAAVLAAETGPAALAAYAQAMLASHPAGLQPVLSTGWAARHPLVRRMRMLARHRPTPSWRQWSTALLVLGLGASAALLARAAQEPRQPPRPQGQGPTGQGMVFEVASQLGSADWTRRMLRFPGREGVMLGGPSGITLNAMQPGWCLGLMLHIFENGSLRPTGQVLDETCQYALSDWQELRVNGSVVQFVAATAEGPLQAQLSARWVNPDDPALPALMRAELEPTPRLSPEQQQMQARQREQVAQVRRQQRALDRAWREAREAQATR